MPLTVSRYIMREIPVKFAITLIAHKSTKDSEPSATKRTLNQELSVPEKWVCFVFGHCDFYNCSHFIFAMVPTKLSAKYKIFTYKPCKIL